MLLLYATAASYWVRSTLKPLSFSQFESVVLQIGICIFLEMINSYVLYKSYYAAQQLEVYRFAIRCFSCSRCVSLYCDCVLFTIYMCVDSELSASA